jgi:putative NADH-flavin reductase
LKLLILGATGGTGQQLVRQALDAGHRVTAFVRTASKLPIQHPHLTVVEGDVTESGAGMSRAMQGQDAVISALGRGQLLKSEGLIRRSIPLILSAMKECGVRRFVLTSAIGVGDAIHDAPLFSRMFARVLLKEIYADKVIGEELVRQSSVEWIIVQPAQLTNGPLTGMYKAGESLRSRGMPKVSRADVAHFILNQIDKPDFLMKTVRIAY